MLVSETASVDTNRVEGFADPVADLSEPGLNQNRLYALQSIERGEFVMRLVCSLAGKDLWSAMVSRLSRVEQLPAPLAITQKRNVMRAV